MINYLTQHCTELKKRQSIIARLPKKNDERVHSTAMITKLLFNNNITE